MTYKGVVREISDLGDVVRVRYTLELTSANLLFNIKKDKLPEIDLGDVIEVNLDKTGTVIKVGVVSRARE